MKRYRTAADLPKQIAVFPLARVILLPHARLPLTIFEPRYLAMVEDALGGSRLIGIIQPQREPPADSKARADNSPPPLQKVGCVGRISSFAESEKGKLLIALTGLCRFDLVKELPQRHAWRQVEADYKAWTEDMSPLTESFADGAVPRRHFLEVLRRYLERNQMQANWEYVNKSSNETLIDSSCMMSPYGVREKQALLEAKTTAARADMLIALTEMLLAQSMSEESADLQ